TWVKLRAGSTRLWLRTQTNLLPDVNFQMTSKRSKMIRSIRFFVCLLLLITASIIIPSTLMRTTMGADNKGPKKIKPPDKPAIETIVKVGEGPTVRCKGHILHGPNKKN